MERAPDTHQIAFWLKVWIYVDFMVKRTIPAPDRSRTRDVEPVATHHINSAIPLHKPIMRRVIPCTEYDNSESNR
jgi:hypothetical protein